MTRPRILQTDGVEHAVRGLDHPMRAIPESRLERGALQTHRPHIPIGKSFDARVLLAKTDAARQQHNRTGKVEPAKIDAQTGVR